MGIIRRIVHTFYQNNWTFSLKKTTKQTERGNKLPILNNYLKNLLKMLGFSLQETTRRINDPRNTISRETFLRRIKEIRKNEPHRKIVCTDETWLHAGHGVKKEWVDLKALENPRCSIVDYGTVGRTKDLMGRGKRLIIVDCITENGLILRALWTFSTESKTKKGEII